MLLLPEQAVNLRVAQAADNTRRQQLLSFSTLSHDHSPGDLISVKRIRTEQKTLHMHVSAPLQATPKNKQNPQKI